MTGQLIDLTQIDFWLAFIVGVIVLSPLSHSPARQYVWAAINLGFATLILGRNVVNVFIAIPLLFLVMRGIAGRNRLQFAALAAMTIAALFTVHKLPAVAEQLGATTLSSVLSVLGFSYIALRMIELMRAVFEQRHPPPALTTIVNYLIPFHMVAAGPIQAYDDFVAQPPVARALDRREILSAAERITEGLFKKFVLAYAIQQMFLTDFQAGGPYFLVEVQFFFLWLFLDFSAYSDIAVGVGRLLGIATPENFNRPYLARNAIDFWERWHISLSQFIRRNVFIPLQLQLARSTAGRRPLFAASLAFSVAFVLCGLWHDLNLNFLLWGAIHAAGLIIANLWREHLKRRLGSRGVKRYLEDRRIKWLARFVTYEFVAFSLVALFIP